MLATTGERNTLTVSALSAANTNDIVAGEDLQRGWVDTLLVDDDEVFVSAVAQALLELHDLHDTIIGELSLGLNKFLPLVSVAPEESRVHLSLFVLKTHVEAHNVAVLKARWHVTLATTVVKDETADEARLSGHLVLHVHDFNHVQVDTLVTSDRLHGVDNNLSERVGDGWVDLGVEGGAGDIEKQVTAHLLLRHLESVQEFHDLYLGFLKTINEDSGVNTLAKVSLGLTHELSDEKHIGRGAVTNDIILSSCCTADHSGSGVLNLHLVEEDATIFGKFNLSSATYEPILFKAAAKLLALCFLFNGAIILI